MTDSLTIPTTPVYNVSNSEAITWLSCKRMWEFAFGHELAPTVTPIPLARGTLGHLYFQRYAEARLNGASHDLAVQHAEAVFMEAMQEGLSPELVMMTQFLCRRYMDHHKGWPEWIILGTEERLDLSITEQIGLPIRYDLYVEEIATGMKRVVDYKFTYNFWYPHEHDLNPQMPKYIGVMRANGLQVDGGYLEQIRTREIKGYDPKKLWHRTRYDPTVKKIRSVLQQHVGASLEIQQHQSLPPAQRWSQALPVLNKYGVCKLCNFKDLCASMNEGVPFSDLAVTIRENYTENTYGYNKEMLDEIL